MRQLLFIITTTVVVVIMLIFGARTLGSAKEPSISAMAKFAAEQCDPQPCWHGIQPGKTSAAQAEALLAALPGSTPDKLQFCPDADSADTSCWRVDVMSWSQLDPTSPVGMMVFQPPADAFHLVDAVRLFGDPINSMMCYISTPSSGDIGPEIPRPLMISYVAFKGGIKVVAYNPHGLLSRRVDMSMSIYRMYLQPAYDVYSPRWNGFSQQTRLGCNMG
jgi:hypothetical protein